MYLCPECDARQLPYDGELWRCENGHLHPHSAVVQSAPVPQLEPESQFFPEIPSRRRSWRSRLVSLLPATGGVCGIAALVLQLLH